MKRILKKCAIAVLTALLMQTANAGLESAMNKVFGDMVNVTEPGAYNTQRRGVVSGGGISVRSPIVSANLVNVSAPKLNADCDGIDFFGGSFSFISADQFVSLLRAVAANAKGYAFKLALEAACPSCLKNIETLAEQINGLNQMLGNSCQLAQGLLTSDGRAAYRQKITQTFESMSRAAGSVADAFMARTGLDGKNATDHATEDSTTKEAAKHFYGNVAYKAFTDKQNAKTWFPTSLFGTIQDAEALKYLMSFTGAFIINKVEQKDAENGSDVAPDFHGPTLTLKDLLEGHSSPKYRRCVSASEGCLETTTETGTEALTGFDAIISKALKGTTGTSETVASSDGLIQKFSVVSGNALTKAELGFLTGLPQGTMAMLRNLAMYSPQIAYAQADEIAKAIALQFAYEMYTGIFNAVETALYEYKGEGKAEALKELREIELNFFNQYQAYAKQRKSMLELIKNYEEVMKMTDKLRLVTSSSGAQSYFNVKAVSSGG